MSPNVTSCRITVPLVCGAYCEGTTRHFTFDVASGRQIHADDLLTPSGVVEIAARLTSQQVARIKAEIVKLQRAADRNGKGAEASAGDGERAEAV